MPLSASVLQFIWVIVRDAAKRTGKVAAAFWVAWLVLVALELAVGASALLGVSYLTSIPLLVICTSWTSRHVLVLANQRVLSLCILGLTVLAFSAFIVAVGMLATTGLKALVQG